MTPQILGEELRQFRESKRITLLDVSSMTRISVSLLEAIEEGRFEVLPPAYVRAMIREFAEYIGMDTGAVLRKYDLLRDDREKESKQVPEPTLAKASGALERIVSYTKGSKKKFLHENVVFVVLIALAIVLSYLLLHQGQNGPSSSTVAEIPFDRVVHETEAATGGLTSTGATQLPRVPERFDSLTLHLETTDSVWISVTMDGKRTEEYLFPPGWSRIWKAESEFVVTMGNAGGGTFRLNDVDIGTLGKLGAVIRSVRITKDRVRRP